MRRLSLIAAALAALASPLLAQTTTEAAAAPDAAAQTEQRLRLATSSIEYPVTPSDVYLLTYRQSTGETITRQVQVGSDYYIDLGVFGKIDATKMAFADLKRRVEMLYSESYARSYPSLTINSIGVFRVSVTGEVPRSSYVNAWGLTRLSEIVDEIDSRNASVRTVGLKGRSGALVRYDVLRATRLGDTLQDPLVKPGDVVTLYPAGRTIRLSGEVRQPGTYELLPTDGLRELIEQIGGGLTPHAEATRVRIDRITKTGLVSEYASLPKDYDAGTSLETCISVTVSSKLENLPVVWFEGAVLGASRSGAQGDAQASAATAIARSSGDSQTNAPEGGGIRIAVQISDGQLLSDALQEVRSSILPMADLASASLFRQGSPTPIAVNLQPLLATPNPPSDIPLRPYDRVFIPTLKSSVRVAGAVLEEGSFAYQPNSPAAYYIGLAGGADPLRNENGACVITDSMGNRRPSDSIVLPGDQIFVLTNLAGITVSGAVTTPGVLPFQSGLPPSLYINQAGGIDPERGTGSFYITDLRGKRQKSDEPLSPGDRIFVRQNKLSYNIVQYLPVITGIVTLATSVITLYSVLQ